MRPVLVAAAALFSVLPDFVGLYGSQSYNFYGGNGRSDSDPDKHHVASTGTTQEATQNACVAAAFDDYNKANLTILMQQGTAPLMSVESIIAQRRLQEQYCLRFARCRFGDPNNQSFALPYRAAFASCLRDESFEK